MTDGDLDPKFVGQHLQFALPQAQTGAVAAATVSVDQQLLCTWITRSADLAPPAADARDGELSGVGADADIDEASIGGNVVYTIRHRLAEFGNGKVMHPDRLRLPFGPQFTAGIFEVADKLFLLRVDGDHRLPGGLECFHLGVDMLELSVAIGVVGTFAGLAVGLQAEVETFQQPANQLLTGDEAPLGQRRGEMALAQADPPQRSLGVTADRRLHQFIQSFQDPGLDLDRGLLSAPLRRTRSLHRTAPDRRSARPRPMVLRAIPVVRETAAIPPRPAARASLAANRRRSLSLRNGSSASKRAWMASRSIIPQA